jgi:hypothetical protein
VTRCAILSCALLACGGKTLPFTTSSDAGVVVDSGPPEPIGPCYPAAGLYTVTYTADASNPATCASGRALSGDEEVDPATSTADAGEGCASTTLGCDTTVRCMQSFGGGGTVTIDLDEVTPSDGAGSFSGTLHIVATGPAAQDCSYTFFGKLK